MRVMSPFVFKPSKQIIFSTKHSTIDTTKHRYKIPRLSPALRRFNAVKPVRPFNRFSQPKIADTGIDPSSCFIHFIKKDPAHPYMKSESSIYDDYKIKYSPNIPIKNNLKSISNENILSTKTLSNNYKLPSIKISNTNRNNNNFSATKRYESTYLSTDNISIRPKNEITKSYSNLHYPFLEMKEGFDINQESGSYWVPRDEFGSVSNRSSVDYNIISGIEEQPKQHIGMFEKNIFNKKKGIAEFSDYIKPFNINPNYKFLKRYDENKDRFKFYKGVFSELYDSASKNGNMYLPFRSDNKKKKKCE